MSAGPDGNATDLIGEHGRARAAWGIRGVNTAMRGFYGDLYGPPDVSTLATASEIAHAPARYTGAAKDVGGFTERAFAGGDIAGITLYLSYAAPLPGQYVLSTYFAYVDRGAENLLPTAEAVMTTNSCQTQLRPPPPSSASSAKSASRSRSSSGDSEDDKLKDYNAQLGTQWAHSSTGQHYLLDYASQWNDTGPDGPGYYIKSGNSVEKLTNGW